MKFFTEEITTLKDGTVASAITEKESEREALSAFHMIMASAIINDNVDTIHAEAKNNIGGVYKSDTWSVPHEPEPEPVEPTEE